jgi:two-component sensor histidine kinase
METSEDRNPAPPPRSEPAPGLRRRTRRIPGLLAHYGFALVAAGAALLGRHLLVSLVGPSLAIYLFFYPAVMLTATLYGFGPGLVATAGSAFLAAHWVLPPAGFAVSNPADAVGLVLFVAMGVSISVVAELYLRGRAYRLAYSAAQRELERREQAEAALRITLADKEAALADNQALLREVHHRVKNNLQMLCDLMFLQIEALPDRDQHRDLQDAYSRIYAIARLHEQIYRSMQSGQIQLTEYLGRLVAGFASLYPDVPVTLEAAKPDVLLDLDRAIHVGLIVNELLTNAIKHAFPAGEPGTVVVAVCAADDHISLAVHDNGRGLPADFDLEHATSLGLRTVYLLARRLPAQVTVTGNGGTRFTLTFPLHAEAPVEPK